MGREVIVPPGGGVVLLARGSTLRFMARGEDTSDAFSLFEREVPPGGRRPLRHRHPSTVEAFYVLAGSLALEIDGVEHLIEAGGSAVVPAGSVHTAGSTVGTIARFLTIHSPALDPYFTDLAALDRAGKLDETSERALMRRYGLEVED